MAKLSLDIGMHADISPDDYHGDPAPQPSLSSTIAGRICTQSLRHARYAIDTRDDDGDAEARDLGTAFHTLLLGGRPYHPLPYDNWRTKAAQLARDEARAAGEVPVLQRQADKLLMMATAFRQQLNEHAEGAAMFRDGHAELTAIAFDDARQIYLRARPDYFRTCDTTRPHPYIAIDDLKTTGHLNPEAWTRALFYNGQDIQAAFYGHVITAITGLPVVFRFAVIEVQPPHAIAVIGLTAGALELADRKVRYAMDHWAAALQTNHWPGYGNATLYAELPPAHEAYWLEKELR